MNVPGLRYVNGLLLIKAWPSCRVGNTSEHAEIITTVKSAQNLIPKANTRSLDGACLKLDGGAPHRFW